MKETQHIEWKESWRDEYLKWISGFANAEGGVLVIGKNDKGVVVGVTDAEKLLVDLPNKVRDVLGIMVAVNLVEVRGCKKGPARDRRGELDMGGAQRIARMIHSDLDRR
ncbi:MAG: ATP-binding protein, partial [Alphaproteobacteria bacterium]|nr:ATP-binding protein [Alphaproteobacteria bacterium]